jgi:hypothetical protein
MHVKTDLDLDSPPLVPRRRAATVLSKPTALAAGTALILAAAGCGGSGNSSTGKANVAPAAPAAPTMAEYVAKANAICSASNGSLNATVIKLASDPNPVDAAHTVAGSFIPQIKAQLSQIKAIGTPAGGEAAVAKMDHLLAGDISRIEKDPALAGPAAFDDFAKVAHGYGLTDCAPLS